MRLAAYAGASTVAASAVILRAFNERPNFYSAAVYLGQSTACRMILLNMLLLTSGAMLYALQRILYGPLRPIEIEQLWDKAWYAITETALAMTTFRDEVGVWFFIMFMTLLAGKVWGWIGEGRVEVFGQQPPANPRLFHTRLMASLILSECFDLLMLRYCIRTLQDQPRPGMMVMFAFEFAVLAITSTSTTVRYLLSLQEKVIVSRQKNMRIVEHRAEIRAARQGAATQASTAQAEEPTQEEDLDPEEIDVPGWQEKGKYILFLDLATDFLKLVLYMGFFVILFLFSSMPIHMFRDIFLTTRSFLKRIHDYQKYRNATKDMNTRYPDATAEELARDGTCIICRDEMRVWEEPAVRPAAAGQPGRPHRSPPDERQRAKKLPCGHILHFGCLRSWLERQQVCPTCRRSVLAPNTARTDSGSRPDGDLPNPGAPANQQANRQPIQQGPQQNQNHQAHNTGTNARPQAPNQQAQQAQNGIRARTFALGGIRLTFATGNADQFRNAVQQMRGQNNNNGQLNLPLNSEGSNTASLHQAQQSTNSSINLQDQISNIERQIMQELGNLNLAADQLLTIRQLQAELERIRSGHRTGQQPRATMPGMMPNAFAVPPPIVAMPHLQQVGQPGFALPMPHAPFPPGFLGPRNMVFNPAQHFNPAQQMPMSGNHTHANHTHANHTHGNHTHGNHTHANHTHGNHMHANHMHAYHGQTHQSPSSQGRTNLPPGVTLPEGWSLVPLQPTTRHGQPSTSATIPQTSASTSQTEASTLNRPVANVAPTSLNTIPATTTTTTTTTSTDTAPAVPAPPLEHRPQSQSLDTIDHDTDSSVVTGLPNWGSASGPSTEQRNVEQEAATNGSAHINKGKSKAPTVEDGVDPDDA